MSDTTLLIEDHNQRSPKYVLAALSAWIGSFAAGTVLGYSAPAITSLDTNGSHIHLDDHQKSLFASLMPFGAVVGCVCAGKLICWEFLQANLISPVRPVQ